VADHPGRPVTFLIDRCAGHRLSEWLRAQGHDVVGSRERGPDPGDRALLEWAGAEHRILVIMDKDFGTQCFFATGRCVGRAGRWLGGSGGEWEKGGRPATAAGFRVGVGAVG
jgi:hypothetical protein